MGQADIVELVAFQSGKRLAATGPVRPNCQIGQHTGHQGAAAAVGLTEMFKHPIAAKNLMGR